MTRLNLWLAAAGAASLLAAGAATAQPAPAGELRMVERRIIREGDGPDMIHMRHEGRDPAEHLTALLQLTPAQQPALKAYLDATHPHHEAMEHGMGHEGMGHDGPPPPPKATPERLAEMEAHMAEHTAAMKRQIEATRTFYAQLTPSQKKAFDELPLMLMAGHGGDMMMMRMHGPGHMGMGMPMPPPPPPPPGL